MTQSISTFVKKQFYRNIHPIEFKISIDFHFHDLRVVLVAGSIRKILDAFDTISICVKFSRRLQ